MDSLTSNSKFLSYFHIATFRLHMLYQNYHFVIKGKKSKKTKPYQKLWTLKVLVLSQFDRTFNFMMLVSKNVERSIRVMSLYKPYSLFTEFKHKTVLLKAGNNYLQFNGQASLPPCLTFVTHLCLPPSKTQATFLLLDRPANKSAGPINVSKKYCYLSTGFTCLFIKVLLVF